MIALQAIYLELTSFHPLIVYYAGRDTVLDASHLKECPEVSGHLHDRYWQAREKLQVSGLADFTPNCVCYTIGNRNIKGTSHSSVHTYSINRSRFLPQCTRGGGVHFFHDLVTYFFPTVTHDPFTKWYDLSPEEG
ncbi:hypothetical protein CEXT_50471 [Caerostris extrusa]|uniref:Uncharacterized protein n=1 Tax=Caerostris extrusa TaxID=172846 RepID=A0AAV4N7V3_CAEEX|nr:hypothetical protein CEXT_50471 [Caerostris extrusa]